MQDVPKLVVFKILSELYDLARIVKPPFYKLVGGFTLKFVDNLLNSNLIHMVIHLTLKTF